MSPVCTASVTSQSDEASISWTNHSFLHPLSSCKDIQSTNKSLIHNNNYFISFKRFFTNKETNELHKKQQYPNRILMHSPQTIFLPTKPHKELSQIYHIRNQQNIWQNCQLTDSVSISATNLAAHYIQTWERDSKIHYVQIRSCRQHRICCNNKFLYEWLIHEARQTVRVDNVGADVDSISHPPD